MDHVGIGEEDADLLPGHVSGGGGGVAVIGGHLHFLAGQETDAAQLVLGEGLGGIEVDGAGVGIAQQAVEHGQVEAQALAGCRAGGDHEVVAPLGRIPALGLVRPQPGDALSGQGVGELEVEADRQGRRLARPPRQHRLGFDLGEPVGREKFEQFRYHPCLPGEDRAQSPSLLSVIWPPLARMSLAAQGRGGHATKDVDRRWHRSAR